MIIVALAFHVEIRLTLSRLFLSTIDLPATRHLPFATPTIFEVYVIHLDIHFRFGYLAHHSQIEFVLLIDFYRFSLCQLTPSLFSTLLPFLPTIATELVLEKLGFGRALKLIYDNGYHRHRIEPLSQPVYVWY